MRIYIAGRVTGLPYEEVKAKFDRAEMLIIDQGHTVVNPTKHVRPEASKSEAMGILLPILCKECDAILLLDDWMFSEGAQIEAQTARYCEKHIINEDDLT
jgi:hypothetical protein